MNGIKILIFVNFISLSRQGDSQSFPWFSKLFLIFKVSFTATNRWMSPSSLIALRILTIVFEVTRWREHWIFITFEVISLARQSVGKYLTNCGVGSADTLVCDQKGLTYLGVGCILNRLSSSVDYDKVSVLPYRLSAFCYRSINGGIESLTYRLPHVVHSWLLDDRSEF